MVGGAPDGNLVHRLALSGEVRAEELFDPGRAWRLRIAVVDEAAEVPRTDHVEVEHAQKLRTLSRAEALDVRGRAHQAELLGAPEGEPEAARRQNAEAAGLAGD